MSAAMRRAGLETRVFAVVVVIAILGSACTAPEPAPSDTPSAPASTPVPTATAVPQTAPATAAPTTDGGPSPSALPTPSPIVEPSAKPVGDLLAAEISTGTQPCATAFGKGSAWISNYGDGTISRVNLDTLSVSDTLAVGSEPCGLALTPAGLWVANLGSQNVARYDPRTGKETARVAGTGAVWDLQSDGTTVWVTLRDRKQVWSIDSATGDVLTMTNLPGTPGGLAVTPTAVWAAVYSADGVLELDPATGALLATVDVGVHPEWFALDGGLWVTATGSQDLVRIDAASATVSASVPVATGRQPADPSSAGGLVWVANRVDGTLRAVDPASARVVQVLQMPTAGAGVVEGHDQLLFVTDFAAANAWVLRLP